MFSLPMPHLRPTHQANLPIIYTTTFTGLIVKDMPEKQTTTEKKVPVVTSIKVDPDLWKQVRIAAIQNDMEVSQLTEQALRKEVDRLKKLGGV
jgi:hypothetical protein